MKTIAIIVYEGVEILDIAGVVEVFGLVNRGLAMNNNKLTHKGEANHS